MRSRYQIIESMLCKENNKILDYGCGNCKFALHLFSHGYKTYGVDLDTFVAIEDLDDNSFNTILSIQVLEHCHSPTKYLEQCYRVLKKNGELIIAIPSLLNMHNIIKQLTLSNKRLDNIKYENPRMSHIYQWDADSLIRLLHHMGFEYVEHKFQGGFTIGKMHFNIPLLNRLCYVMIFRFRKIDYENMH